MILMDTSAWVENFKGSEIGKTIEEYLNNEEIIIPSVVLIELSRKSVTEKWYFENVLKFIKSKSSIIGINEKIIIKCGRLYHQQKKNEGGFGMIDSVILTTAKEFNAKVLTKDNDFRGLENVIIIEEK